MVNGGPQSEVQESVQQIDTPIGIVSPGREGDKRNTYRVKRLVVPVDERIGRAPAVTPRVMDR